MATRPGFCAEDNKYYDFLLNEIKPDDYVVAVRKYFELHIMHVKRISQEGNCSFKEAPHVHISLSNVISLRALGIPEPTFPIGKKETFDKTPSDILGNKLAPGDKVLCTAGRYISCFIAGTIYSINQKVVIKAYYSKQAKKCDELNTFLKDPGDVISLTAYGLDNFMPDNEWVKESPYYHY